MLKLLSIQVQKSCAENIKRCLKTDLMYYLCNDYVITQPQEGVWSVSKRDEYVDIISEDFYRIDKKRKLRVNISAIVGANGSGKSTIVELILRMINNCAIQYGIRAEEGRLVYVEGVHARLFYMNGNSFFCLTVAGGKESVKVKEIAVEEKGNNRNNERELTASELKDHFFYTLVSNYSHYAYNTYDFRSEWQKQTDEDSCWLKWLFHKNDGYQTPITLHPFRDQGTVSIQREKNLSNQRLLYFFINYAKRNNSKGVFSYINGKSPKYLNLQEIRISKLQQITLLQYFSDYKDVNLLGDQIIFAESLKDKVIKSNSSDSKDFEGGILQPLERLAYRTMGLNKNEIFPHHHYYKALSEWITSQDEWWQREHRTSLLPGNSDLRQLLNAVESLVLSKDINARVRTVCTALRKYDMLNMCQLQRLEILDDVCDLWHGKSVKGMKTELLFVMSPELITSSYEDLSQSEKCYHYITYKTIDVLETYPSYHYPLWSYSNRAVCFSPSSLEEADEKKMVQAAFQQLLEDVTEEKTHITLKMRQAFYYLKHSVYEQNNAKGYNLTGEKVKGIEGICLSSERMAELYQNEDEQDLETLPPPIYERHLLFETQDGKLVDMDTFSSGEKQLLNTQSAIIYHLQNLNSIFKDPARMKYPQVNIILEEIELYFHPEYQRCFIDSLLNLMEQSVIDEHITDVNILIVTHSPFILSDIPKSHVLFLKDGVPNTDMQENTFGANIHSLLTNGFFLRSLPIGEFAYGKINEMFEKLNGAQVRRMDREEREKLYSDIARVGEPYLREQLMRLFNMYYPPYYND